jgi:hypothetical protein
MFTNSLIKFPNGNANQKLAASYKPSSNSSADAQAFHHRFFLCTNSKQERVHSPAFVVEESEESASASSSLYNASLAHQ